MRYEESGQSYVVSIFHLYFPELRLQCLFPVSIINYGSVIGRKSALDTVIVRAELERGQLSLL